uniref:SPIN-DOC-like zinc-finger domain-containing protein n=1 Tax=Varanus komodoensis TaxID=61221 RepID=A0A8D2J4Y9_VARKO
GWVVDEESRLLHGSCRPAPFLAPGEPPVARVGPEEPGGSWRQEYLIAERAGRRQPVCMVCGGLLSASGPAAARRHIQRHHAHSLGFSPEEKRNILEAWSEGAVLPAAEPPPRPAGKPRRAKRPAEIEVLLDSEEQPASRKRGQPKARCGECRGWRGPGESPLGRKEWLSECGVPGSAPAEIRIFTDGTFPAGFALKLYCRTQPGRLCFGAGGEGSPSCPPGLRGPLNVPGIELETELGSAKARTV